MNWVVSDTVASAALGALASWTAKAAVLLLLAGCVCLGLRRRSAAWRHAIWAVAVAGALAMPLFETLGPALPLPGMPVGNLAGRVLATRQANAVENSSEVPATTILAMGDIKAETDVAGPAVQAAAPRPASTIAWQRWLLSLWLAGVAAMLVPALAGSFSLWRLGRRSDPMSGELAELLQRLGAESGIGRTVRGLIADSRSIPMTWGLLRPIVLLPREADGWAPARVRIVMLHELAHVRRWDCLVQLIGQATRAAFWFNPLAWWAAARLRVEQEQACDDCVLRAGAEADQYASELLNITTGFRAGFLSSAVALAMGRPVRPSDWTNRKIPSMERLHRRPTDLTTLKGWSMTRLTDSVRSAVAPAMGRAARLERRLQAILNEGLDRRPLGWRGTLAALACGVGLTLVLAALSGGRAEAANPNPVPATTGAAAEQSPEADKNAAAEKPAAAVASGPTLQEIRDLIRQQYGAQADEHALTEGAIRGMLEALGDPNAQFLPAEAVRQISSTPIAGIGAQLHSQNDQVIVVSVFPKSPAHLAGIKANDVVLEVNGQPAGNLTQAVEKIRGAVGTVAKLRVRRGKEELEIEATRGTIQLPVVQGLFLDAEAEWQYWLSAKQKIGYAQIMQFSGRTAEQLKSVVENLSKESMKGLVLDLRGCPGGMLADACNTAQLFLKQGPIVSIKNRAGEEQQSIQADGSAPWGDLPLALVIDEHTASAAEILAGALVENQRAVAVGVRTFGKGSVQSVIPLAGRGEAFKLTTAFVYVGNGRGLQRQADNLEWGVDPGDGFFVPTTAEQLAKFDANRRQRAVMGAIKPEQPLTAETVETELADPQLAAAWKTLAAKIASGEFSKIGQSAAELKAHVARREELRKRRDELRKQRDELGQSLEKIDNELGRE